MTSSSVGNDDIEWNSPSSQSYSFVWTCKTSEDISSVKVKYQGKDVDVTTNTCSATPQSMQTYFRLVCFSRVSFY